MSMSMMTMSMSMSLSSSYNHRSLASNKLHSVSSSSSLHKTIKQIVTNSLGIKEPLQKYDDIVLLMIWVMTLLWRRQFDHDEC